MTKGDGAKALSAFLLSVDIRNFNPRKLPNNKYLRDQKEINMVPVHQWWYSCLTNGTLNDNIVTDECRGCEEEDWYNGMDYEIAKPNLYKCYILWCKSRGRTGDFNNEASFFNQLSKICVYRTLQKTIENSIGGGKTRKRFAILPSLNQCRETMSIKYKGLEYPDKGVMADHNNETMEDFLDV